MSGNLLKTSDITEPPADLVLLIFFVKIRRMGMRWRSHSTVMLGIRR